MHKILSLLLILMLSVVAQAQQKADITGIYHSTSRSPEGSPKLMVFEDGFYMIPYFGGVQMGNWVIMQDTVVEFKPYYIKDRFAVYGRYNPKLKDSVRAYFTGCERVATYIGFVEKHKPNTELRRIFNEDANCFDWPFVHTFPNTIADTMILRTYANEYYADTTAHSFAFSNEGQYNDFIIEQYVPKYENNPFYGRIRKGKLVFGEDDYSPWEAEKSKLELEGENLKFVEVLRQQNGKGLPDTVFYNASYNEFGGNEINDDFRKVTIDSFNFRYDKVRNAMVNIHWNAGELESPNDDNFQDDRIIYFFQRMKNVVEIHRQFRQNEQSVLHYSCGGNRGD